MSLRKDNGSIGRPLVTRRRRSAIRLTICKPLPVKIALINHHVGGESGGGGGVRLMLELAAVW